MVLVFLKKIGNQRILSFGCSIAKYGDWQVLGGIGGTINFLEIERIIIPILAKYELMGRGAKINESITIQVYFECMGFEELKNRPQHKGIQIHNKDDVDYVVEAIKTNYLTYTKIGFEKFTSIEQFVPLIEGKDFKQMLPILGQFSYFKKAIILKLTNMQEYQTYINEVIEITEKFMGPNKDSRDGIKWHNAAIELKQILDNTPPIYNV